MELISLLEISIVALFLFFIMLFILKLPMLPHIFLFRIKKKQHDIAQQWKISKIDDWARNNDKSEKIFKAVYGEFKGFRTIEHALSKRLVVNVIFGDKIFDQTSKDRLIKLKKQFGDQLIVYKLNYRPIKHSTLINNNYFLEAEHSIKDNYETALVYNNAEEEIIQTFNTEFEILKNNANKLNLKEISELDLYFPENNSSNEREPVSSDIIEDIPSNNQDISSSVEMSPLLANYFLPLSLSSTAMALSNLYLSDNSLYSEKKNVFFEKIIRQIAQKYGQEMKSPLSNSQLKTFEYENKEFPNWHLIVLKYPKYESNLLKSYFDLSAINSGDIQDIDSDLIDFLERREMKRKSKE